VTARQGLRRLNNPNPIPSQEGGSGPWLVLTAHGHPANNPSGAGVPPRPGGLREIRLDGHAIGSDAFARTDIIVQRGQYMEWTLETDLRHSSVAVL